MDLVGPRIAGFAAKERKEHKNFCGLCDLLRQSATHSYYAIIKPKCFTELGQGGLFEG